MDANVKRKLERGIESLLNAGRNTKQVTDLLAPQASFGKYDGCTPDAIEKMAITICKRMNRENRAKEREMIRLATQSLRRQGIRF